MALTVLVLQGSGSGHMLLVEHSRCVAHGELIHGETGAAHQEDRDRRPVQAARGFGTSVHSAADFDAGHDHCVPVGERRDLALALDGLEAIAHPVALEASGIEPHAIWSITTATFRTAPKTSPPT